MRTTRKVDEVIKDSGEHKEEGTGTGAVRSSGEGRGRPSLLPFDALMEVSIHFEEGAAKYDDRNWEKGLKLSRYLDSMLRHVTDITMGDTSESHERAIAWNALCFLATWKRIENGTLPAELDDLPHRVASGGLEKSDASEVRSSPGTAFMDKIRRDNAALMESHDEREQLAPNKRVKFLRAMYDLMSSSDRDAFFRAIFAK